MSGSIGYFSGNVGTSVTYNTIGIGLTYGRPFSFMRELTNSGTVNIGITTFIGQPFLLNVDFGRWYINTMTFLGGQ